ncbi:MAG TPA: cob(I)yrinic acid a,c-diamide adenosyltransferase [Gemmatimonadales bacterium]
MRIYTRTGDSGDTGLMGGGRVPKDDARVGAYGDVDETSAAIGLARTLEPRDLAEALLSAVQRDLFAIGGTLATPDPGRVKETVRDRLALPAERVAALEQAIDEAEAKLPALTSFVLPGGSPKAAALHLARTICRRAERAVVHLSHVESVPADVIVYLNRLSDLLFTLARLANQRAGHPDNIW